MNYLFWQEISFFLNDIDKEKTLFEKSSMNTEAMENTRKKMTELVDVLKSSLEQRLDKYHASLIIFPIVAAIDEKMQGYDYSSNKSKWMPLQKDYYAAYNAGEIFFKSLDDILDDQNIPNIVFQVYYTILKRGFQGKYKDSKTQISKYLDMLKDKIPVSNQIDKKTSSANSPIMTQKKSWLKKWHCYSCSVGMAIAVFGILILFAHFS